MQPTSLVQAGVAPDRSKPPFVMPPRKDDYAQMLKPKMQTQSYEYEHYMSSSKSEDARHGFYLQFNSSYSHFSKIETKAFSCKVIRYFNCQIDNLILRKVSCE